MFFSLAICPVKIEFDFCSLEPESSKKYQLCESWNEKALPFVKSLLENASETVVSVSKENRLVSCGITFAHLKLMIDNPYDLPTELQSFLGNKDLDDFIDLSEALVEMNFATKVPSKTFVRFFEREIRQRLVSHKKLGSKSKYMICTILFSLYRVS